MNTAQLLASGGGGVEGGRSDTGTGVFLNCCKLTKPQSAMCDDHANAGSAVPKGLSSRGPGDNRLCPLQESWLCVGAVWSTLEEEMMWSKHN